MFLRSLRIILFVLLGTSSVCLHAQEPNSPLGPILQRDTTTADTIRIIDHRTLKEIGIYNQDLSDTLMHYYSLLRFPEGTRIHTGQLGGALNNLYNYDESDIGYDL